jgi:hypothetical protein
LTISGWRPGHGELRDSEPMARLQISQSRHERGRGRISENRDQWALALDALSGKIPVAYVSITMHWCIRDSVGDPEGTSTSRLMSGGSCGGHAQCNRGADRDGGHAGERCFGSAQFS